MAGSTGSKIPLRGITKVLEHLDPGTRAKLESAFAEAEDLMDFHNRSVVDQQNRRRLSSLIDAPVVNVDKNNLGFDVNWNRLTDRRISFYEVQISLDSVFASPSTYTTVNTSLAVEGHVNTTFVRVRGIRSDGQTGPWSDSVTVEPEGFTGPVLYSRDITDIPAFYASDPSQAYPAPIQRIEITPQRVNGGIMVFGSIGGQSITGDFELKVNETLVQQFTVDNVPAFAFGPCFVSHDNFYFTFTNAEQAGAAANQGSAGSAGTHSGWNVNTTVVGNPPLTADVTYDVNGLSKGSSTTSRNYQATQFGFAIPSTHTIIGIQVDVGVEYQQFGTTTVNSEPQLNRIRLMDGGTARTYTAATNIPFGSSFGVPIAQYTFGGPTDLWGEAAGFWTPSKINDSGFGVDLRARFRYSSSDPSGRTQFDRCKITGYTVTVYAQTPTSEAVVKLTSPNIVGGPLLNCTMNAIEFGE